MVSHKLLGASDDHRNQAEQDCSENVNNLILVRSDNGPKDLQNRILDIYKVFQTFYISYIVVFEYHHNLDRRILLNLIPPLWVY